MSAAHLTPRSDTTGRFLRRHTVNEAFFDSWSADMAWCLGYICADGCVSKTGHQVSFGINAEDVELLHSVRAVMGSTASVRIVARQGDGGFSDKPVARLAVSSAALVRRLKDLHGVLPRKTYGDPAMPNVPDQFLGDFLRGLFDGDGCFHRRNTTYFQAAVWLTGTHRLLSDLSTALCRVYGVRNSPPRPMRGRPISQVAWTSKRDVVALWRAMYPAGVRHYLGRKKTAMDAAIAAMPAAHVRMESGTGYRGVSRRPEGFVAQFRANKRTQYLGYYTTAEAAAVAYNWAAKSVIGDRAVLNPIPPETPEDVVRWAEGQAAKYVGG